MLRRTANSALSALQRLGTSSWNQGSGRLLSTGSYQIYDHSYDAIVVGAGELGHPIWSPPPWRRAAGRCRPACWRSLDAWGAGWGDRAGCWLELALVCLGPAAPTARGRRLAASGAWGDQPSTALCVAAGGAGLRAAVGLSEGGFSTA